MTKIVLALYAVVSLFKLAGSAISHLFQPKGKSQVSSTSVSGGWYGICEKCGAKGGLHQFEGKRYCAVCHARLTAEKKYGAKQGQNES